MKLRQKYRLPGGWRGMFPLSCLLILLVVSACTGAGTSPAQVVSTQPPGPVDWKQVDQVMGKAGAMQPGGVYKYSWPRTDLQVMVRGVQLKAAFALGSHVEFLPMGTSAMVMGDLVLTEAEVTPVLTKLFLGGIGVTALHNHLLYETPAVMYLHLEGRGDPVQLARAIHAALTLTKTPLTASAGAPPLSAIDLDTKQLDHILGATGKISGGIYQVSIPRAEKIMAEGMQLPPAMGTASAINFQPTGDGHAAITGDFVLVAQEVEPVIQRLRAHSIEMTALHSHMLTEEPRLFYLHFWANDEAVKLAQGLRAALDKTNRVKATSSS